MLSFACMMPHGILAIPELIPDAQGGLATRSAMEEIGRRCAAAGVETLVVLTPHGTRVQGALCLMAAAHASGSLAYEGRRVELSVPLDRQLTEQIGAAVGARGVPVALASMAGNGDEAKRAVLDWGAFVPLWFLGYAGGHPGHGELLDPPPPRSGPAAVLVAPSRCLTRRQLFEAGAALAEAAQASQRRIALVASCDWSHAHRPDGPYGLRREAVQFDQLVVDAVRADDLGLLMDVPEELTEAAAIDGLWQALILAGALSRVPLRAELLSYEAPTYFGMVVAAFEQRR